MNITGIHGQDARGTHGRDGRATHGRDAHATQTPDGVTTNRLDDAIPGNSQSQVSGPASGASARFFAFNPLGWTRTDVADLPWTGAEPVHVVDLTGGGPTPCQLVTVDGRRCLRVLARDVPPVGYKVFEIRPGAGEKYADAATVTDNVIENRFYRITVAPRGAITSLIDKTRDNREFAAEIDGRVINDLGPGAGRLEVENAGPVSVTLLALSNEPLAHVSRLTLIRDSRRIELDNEITQNFRDVRTWSFAFNLEEPDVWHEEVGAVIRAKLLDQGGHYSPRNARYDWLTMNHFVDVSGRGGPGVTLANADCCFMQLGHSTLTMLDSATPLVSALIGGQVDGLRLGIPDQGGDRYFRQRFALQTHSAFDPVAAMRFALEHQNPLVAGMVAGSDEDTVAQPPWRGRPALASRGHPGLALPDLYASIGSEVQGQDALATAGVLHEPRAAVYAEPSYSLLKVSRPEVFVWAVKPAEEGIEHGVIVRLWNMAHHPVQGEVQFGRPVRRARRTTHVETDLSDVPLLDGRLPVSFAAQQMQTYRLDFEGP
jgi:alpha-mannosidase